MEHETNHTHIKHNVVSMDNSIHKYDLCHFEDKSMHTVLQFIHKEKNEAGEFVTIADGITNEQLLTVLIHRLQGLNELAPCRENSIVITKLEEALMWLEKRTADRIKRGVEGTPAK